ncbi:hypothetical protein ES332_D02G180000v1 [Gossypium tomentosum]|uniref:UBX domain-containing protein n=1 Tax=Gossypium tomentosum TaxID=34277 RepID=A0A5D2LYI4_GOSTO|nr:hypothetical protein ES332_D02G180000v1 [Gossypium tomentosum]
MSEMKDKLKGFMKKVNTQFSSSSSSSGKFKGQGRVLGSSSSSGPVNPILTRPSPIPNPALLPPHPILSPFCLLNHRFLIKTSPVPTLILNQITKREVGLIPTTHSSLLARSEEEVSIHVETCVNNTNSLDRKGTDDESGSNETALEESRGEVEVRVSSFLSGKPAEGSIEVVLKLLRNIVKEPGNDKFRKLRMSNPKIREAIGEVAGGVELLEFVGFELKEEGGEMWAVMDVPKEEQISVISKAIMLLEPGNMEKFKKSENISPTASPEKEETVESKKIDRKIRVFFSVPESVAAKIELPDSFYNLSSEELKREAEMRKKKIADSQLLIPKSYKEKQAKAARRKYRRAIICIQFPDGVVLQGEFAPWEPTSALYEFVSSALKEPCLEFELLDPVIVKLRVIPSFPAAGEKGRTLEEEDLVPSALIRFKPVETDSVVFTGLSNELLEISEPLVTN